MKSKTIDLHDYSLVEAEDYLIDEILEASILGNSSIIVIHGHNGGVVIRNFIRIKLKRRYYNFFKRENIKIKIVPITEGRTQIFVTDINT